MHLFSPKNNKLYALFFLLMFAVVVGDILSESFLITHHSPETLSVMFMVNALALFLVSLAAMGGIDHTSRLRLFSILIVTQTLLLLGLRLTMGWNGSGGYLILFTLAYTAKILMFMVFWTMANDLCDSREAKSVFPFIGAFGVTGGLTANFTTACLSPLVGPANLIYLWVAVLCTCLAMVAQLHKNHQAQLVPTPQPPARDVKWIHKVKDDMGLIMHEPFLKNMSVFYFLIFIIVISLDFQFFLHLKKNLLEGIRLAPEAGQWSERQVAELLGEKIAGFLGVFRGTAGAMTLSIQIAVAGYILKKLGTARSMFIMPFCLTFVFGLIFLQSLWSPFPATLEFLPDPFNNTLFFLLLAGTFVKLSLFDSLFSPNFQIFFSSLPGHIRAKSKLFLEGIAKPAAILIAGASVLGVSLWIADGKGEWLWIHFLFLFVVGCLLCYTVYKIQGQYSQSIAGFLGQYRAQQLQQSLNLKDAGHRDSILKLLGLYLFQSDESLRRLSLEILGELSGPGPRKLLKELLALKDYPHRPAVLRAYLQNCGTEIEISEIQQWLWDADPEVVTAAIRGCAHLPFQRVEPLLQPYLNHSRDEVALAALSLFWKNRNALLEEKILAILKEKISAANASQNQSITRVLSRWEDPKLLPLFQEAWKDRPDEGFIYLEELSRFRDLSAFKYVIQHYHQCSEREKTVLTKNLSGRLWVLEDQLAKLFRELNLKETHVLLDVMYWSVVPLSPAERKHFQSRLIQSISEAAETRELIGQLRGSGRDEVDFFVDALEENLLEVHKANVAHLIAIQDTSGKLRYVTPKLLSTNAFERAAAFEAIETTTRKDWVPQIAPLFLDKIKPQVKWKVDSSQRTARIAEWLHKDEWPWLQICAYFALLKTAPHQIRESDEKKFYNLMNSNVYRKRSPRPDAGRDFPQKKSGV